MVISTVKFSDFRGLQCFAQLTRVVNDGAFSVCVVWVRNRPEVTNVVYELHRAEVGRGVSCTRPCEWNEVETCNQEL